MRVLLGPQEHLRKIILSSERTDETSEAQTLFQQLMKTAVKPSPIKPIFAREELEVSESMPLWNSFYIVTGDKNRYRIAIDLESFHNIARSVYVRF